MAAAVVEAAVVVGLREERGVWGGEKLKHQGRVHV